MLELYDSIRMPELQRGDIGTPLGADPEETQNEMSLQREHGSVQHHTSSEASGGATEEPIDQQRNQPGPTTAERACRTVKEKDDDKVYREVLGRQTEDEYNLFAARLADESYDSTRAVFKRWFEEDTAARRLGAAPTERGISKDFENNADKIAATVSAALAIAVPLSHHAAFSARPIGRSRLLLVHSVLSTESQRKKVRYSSLLRRSRGRLHVSRVGYGRGDGCAILHELGPVPRTRRQSTNEGLRKES